MNIKRFLFFEDYIVIYCDKDMNIVDLNNKAEEIDFFSTIKTKNIFNVFSVSDEQIKLCRERIENNKEFIIRNVTALNEEINLVFYPDDSDAKGNYICLVYSLAFCNNIILQNNISTVVQSLLVNQNDIKGILHNLLPLGNILEESELYEEKEKYISEITKRCYNLMRNNMQAQQYYDLTNNISSVKMIDVCINEFLEDYFAAIRQLVIHAGYDIKLVLCDQRVYARIDVDLITSMLTNIISNSCLYSTTGTTITLSLRRTKGAFSIIVKDDGSGMTREVKSRMFDPFFSFDPSNSEKRSGMGLAVAKKIIEIHNGRIMVKSEVEKGTAISITFPASNDLLGDSTVFQLNEVPREPMRNNGFSLIAIAFSQVYHFKIV